MLNRLLTGLIDLPFHLTFCCAGILGAWILAMLPAVMGFTDNPWMFLVLMLYLTAPCVIGCHLLGYALMLAVLRMVRLDAWYERHEPPPDSTPFNKPYLWARAVVFQRIRASLPEP